MDNHTPYDYRMYDHVWQRVSPGCDPYGDTHAAQNDCPCPAGMAVSGNADSAVSMPVPRTMPISRGEGNLPGAQLDPCCMGSEAMNSIEVLAGFIEDELAQRRCYMGLASRIRAGGASRLLCSLAQ